MSSTTVGIASPARVRSFEDPTIRRAEAPPSSFPRATIPGLAALLLANSTGNSLEPLTEPGGTAMLPIGCDLRLIDITLGNCLNSGVARVGVIAGHAANSVAAHVDKRWAPFAASHQRTIRALPPPDRGTIGVSSAESLRRQLAFIAGGNSSRVLVLACDQVYGMDYGALLSDHLKCGAGLTMTCIAPEPGAHGLGPLRLSREQRVIAIGDSGGPRHLDAAPLAIGACLFEARLLRELLTADAANPDSGHDLWQDVIPAAIRLRRTYAHRLRDPIIGTQNAACWWGISSLDDYWRTNLESAGCRLPRALSGDPRWPLWNGSAAPTRRAQRGAGIAPDSRIDASATISRSVISGGASVGAGSHVESSVLMPGVVVGAGCKIRRALLAEGCLVPAGTVIGDDVVQDRRRFELTPGSVVLVTPAALAKLG